MSQEPVGQQFLFSDSNRIGSDTPNPSTTSVLKRCVDIILAVGALVFFSPIMLTVAIIIKLRGGGNAIFVQRRIGVNGEEFSCFKFRTMVVDAQERLEYLLANDPVAKAQWDASQKLDDDPRITKLGKFLRETSLDELPQLINILKGEMSVVGPRPIVRNEIAKYGTNFEDYCDVRPGLTGLWQVSGRSDTTYDERVALDVEYARDWSLINDIKIIARTVPAIVNSKGAR